MFKKKCPYCERYSYSNDNKSWVCPYCSKHLNNIDAEPASENDDGDDESISKASQNRNSVLEKYLNNKGDDEDA